MVVIKYCYMYLIAKCTVSWHMMYITLNYSSTGQSCSFKEYCSPKIAPPRDNIFQAVSNIASCDCTHYTSHKKIWTIACAFLLWGITKKVTGVICLSLLEIVSLYSIAKLKAMFLGKDFPITTLTLVTNCLLFYCVFCYKFTTAIIIISNVLHSTYFIQACYFCLFIKSTNYQIKAWWSTDNWH